MNFPDTTHYLRRSSALNVMPLDPEIYKLIYSRKAFDVLGAVGGKRQMQIGSGRWKTSISGYRTVYTPKNWQERLPRPAEVGFNEMNDSDGWQISTARIDRHLVYRNTGRFGPGRKDKSCRRNWPVFANVSEYFDAISPIMKMVDRDFSVYLAQLTGTMNNSLVELPRPISALTHPSLFDRNLGDNARAGFLFASATRRKGAIDGH